MTSCVNCPLNSYGVHRSWDLRLMSGASLIPHPRPLHIHHDTTISNVFATLADFTDHPDSYIALVVGEQRFQNINTIVGDLSPSDFHRPRLEVLRRELVQQAMMTDNDALNILVLFLPPPDRFLSSTDCCLCDFAGNGCCLSGESSARGDRCRTRVRSVLRYSVHMDCSYCGNCQVCRSGNCRHPCCAMIRSSDLVDVCGNPHRLGL
jgi:hypothetical protein